MPNVVILGYAPDAARALRSEIHTILTELGKAEESITTIIGNAETQHCSRSEPAPYLIVWDTNRTLCRTIAGMCAKKLNVDVQYQTVGFIPAGQQGSPDLSTNVTTHVVSADSQINWDQILALEMAPEDLDFLRRLRVNHNLPTELRSECETRFYYRARRINTILAIHSVKYKLRKKQKRSWFYLRPVT